MSESTGSSSSAWILVFIVLLVLAAVVGLLWMRRKQLFGKRKGATLPLFARHAKKAIPVRETPPARKPTPTKETPPARKPTPTKETTPTRKPTLTKETPPARKPTPTKETPPTRKPTPAQTDVRDAMLHRLYDARQRQQEYASYIVYAKVFDYIALPLQFLLGIDAAITPENAERMQTQLEAKVFANLAVGLQAQGASLDEQGFHIPREQPPEAQPFEAFKSRYASIADEDIRQEVDASQSAAPYAYLECRRALDLIGRPLDGLHMLHQHGKVNPDELHEAARQIRDGMRQAGIEPLMYNDLTDDPQLQDTFRRAHAQAITTPGFFLRKEGQLVQYGNYYGSHHFDPPAEAHAPEQ